MPLENSVAPAYSGATFQRSPGAMSRRKNIWFFLLLSVYVAAFYLVLKGEFAAISAWLLVTCMLLPGVLVTLKNQSVALRFFSLTLFLTQFIGVPVFVVKRAAYNYAGWSGVKAFSFGLPEFFAVYFPVGLFFVGVPFLFWVIGSAFPGVATTRETSPPFSHRIRGDRSLKIWLTLAIVFLVFIHAWMFRNRIAMLGITPPLLPMHLSGLLNYATRFFFPVILVFFYARSGRSLYLTVLLMSYALILGLSHISRSSSMFILLPLALFAVRDKRWAVLMSIVLWSALCIQLATLMRDIAYEDRILKTGIGEGYSLFLSTVRLFSTLNVSLDLFWSIPIAVLNRIESPQNLALAYQFNADAVGGISQVLVSLFREGMGQIDSRNYTVEWCGELLPDDFGFRGGLLSNVVMSSQAGLPWLAICTVYVAICLYVTDMISRSWAVRLKSQVAYYAFSIVGVVIILLSMGTPVFWGFFLFGLFVVIFLPGSLFARTENN